jgi:hypothetical protein
MERHHVEQSEQVYLRIAAAAARDDDAWLSELDLI